MFTRVSKTKIESILTDEDNKFFLMFSNETLIGMIIFTEVLKGTSNFIDMKYICYNEGVMTGLEQHLMRNYEWNVEDLSYCEIFVRSRTPSESRFFGTLGFWKAFPDAMPEDK